MDLLYRTYFLAVLLACVVFQSGAQEKNYTVREELPENVLIGNLLKDLNLTLDPDVPLSSPLQFKLVYKTGDVPLVHMEENTGEIFTTANRISSEGGWYCHPLRLRAYDMSRVIQPVSWLSRD